MAFKSLENIIYKSVAEFKFEDFHLYSYNFVVLSLKFLHLIPESI